MKRIKRGTVIFTILTFANILLFGTSYAWMSENESYIEAIERGSAEKDITINNLEKDLEEAEESISDKDKLIELKSMQLIYKSDVYKQQQMKEEGIKYQEYWEGLDAE